MLRQEPSIDLSLLITDPGAINEDEILRIKPNLTDEGNDQSEEGNGNEEEDNGNEETAENTQNERITKKIKGNEESKLGEKKESTSSNNSMQNES